MQAAERIKILQDLIHINSVNGNEIEVAQYLKNLFERHGLSAKLDPFGTKRANLVLDIGTGKRVLGLTGHMDTVAFGDESNWSYPPLAATIVGDRIYGRGAADMKSGLAAQAIAIIELFEAHQIKGHLRFIATAGEEYGTPGANRLQQAGIAEDLTALVVGEATGGNVVYAHAGSFNYRVVSQGKSVHSSTPELGENALSPLVDFYVAERDLFADVALDPYLGELKHSVTIFKGGQQVNTIPDTAELYGNIRPTRVFDNQQVLARLQAAIQKINENNKAQLILELIHDWRPVASKPDSLFVQTALKASQKAFSERKQTPELMTINGATDASVFVKANPDLPVIVLGPDRWEFSHQLDEYTTLSSYQAIIQVYKEIMQSYFG